MELDEEVAKPDEKGFIAGEKIIVDEKIETGRVYLIFEILKFLKKLNYL